MQVSAESVVPDAGASAGNGWAPQAAAIEGDAFYSEGLLPETPHEEQTATSAQNGVGPGAASHVLSMRNYLSVARVMSTGRHGGQHMAEGAMAFVQKTISQACEEEPTVFARECKHFVLLKRKFPQFCGVWLLMVAALFCVVGLAVDVLLFQEPTYYWIAMPISGVMTWAIIVARVWLGVFKSTRASDVVSTFTFLAAFVVLHAFVFEQVGIGSHGSVYSAAYTSVTRRLQAPRQGEVKDIGDIYKWMHEWTDEWIPETTNSAFIELHPGWTSYSPPAVWTQRVKRRSCGHLSFSWESCTWAGELDGDTEMTAPWVLTFKDPTSNATAEKAIPHQSGEFKNFHGQARQSPAYYGKIGTYQFRRGYCMELCDMPGRNASVQMPVISNRSHAKKAISGLEDAGFIDLDTRLVYMQLTLVHDALHQWIVMRVIFEIGVFGNIETSTNIYQGMTPSCKFKDEARNHPPFTYLQNSLELAAERFSGPCVDHKECKERLETLGLSEHTCDNIVVQNFYPAAMAYFLGLADRMHFPLAVGSGYMILVLFALVTFLFLEEVLQMLLLGRAYFKQASNYVEMFTIIDVSLIMQASISQQDATPQDAFSWELYTTRGERLQRLCGFACFMWWMRLLNLVSGIHPRMRVLIHTMQRAWVDLVFFCAMFGIVLFAFSVTFHIWFATREASFHDMFVTFTTLFRGLIGDITAGALLETWDVTISYMMYVVLSMLILVNVFIAIISASFEAQQTEQQVQEQRKQEQEAMLESWILQDPAEDDGDSTDVIGDSTSDVLKVVLWGGRGLRPSDYNGLADSCAILGLRASCDEGSYRSHGYLHYDSTSSDIVQIPVRDRLLAFEARPVRSEVVPSSLDPDWGLKATFLLPPGVAESDNLEIYIKVFDQDDWMGKAQVNLFELLFGRRDRKPTRWSPTTPRSTSTKSPGASRAVDRRKVKRHPLRMVRSSMDSGVVLLSAMLYNAATDEDDTEEGDVSMKQSGSVNQSLKST